MSEITRKRRFLGKLNKLLDAAIAKGDVKNTGSLIRIIAELNGWIAPTVSRSDPEMPDTGSNANLARLIATMAPEPNE